MILTSGTQCVKLLLPLVVQFSLHLFPLVLILLEFLRQTNHLLPVLLTAAVEQLDVLRRR